LKAVLYYIPAMPIMSLGSTRMTIYEESLLEALAAKGWELASVETSAEWWAEKTWILRSVWSPNSSLFYLTFLVDPMADGQSQSSKNIWAVKASLTVPAKWQECDGEITLRLGRGCAARMSEFVSDISKRFRQVST
jgi:hypothetical protein